MKFMQFTLEFLGIFGLGRMHEFFYLQQQFLLLSCCSAHSRLIIITFNIVLRRLTTCPGPKALVSSARMSQRYPIAEIESLTQGALTSLGFPPEDVEIVTEVEHNRIVRFNTRYTCML